jgi:hypothetical protein
VLAVCVLKAYRWTELNGSLVGSMIGSRFIIQSLETLMTQLADRFPAPSAVETAAAAGKCPFAAASATSLQH